MKRNKHSYSFKLRCVEAVLRDNRSVKEVARAEGFEESNLRLWLGFYQRYGRSGLEPGGKRQYEASFKLKVLKAIDSQCLSLREACVRFNIRSDSVIINWRRAYEKNGPAGLIAKPKGRPKMKPQIKRKPRKSSKPLTREEELLLENEYLRAENELLKKLQALAQTSKKRKP